MRMRTERCLALIQNASTRWLGGRLRTNSRISAIAECRRDFTPVKFLKLGADVKPHSALTIVYNVALGSTGLTVGTPCGLVGRHRDCSIAAGRGGAR